MGSYSEIYHEIKKIVDETLIVDTHEHLVQEKDRIANKADLFQTFLVHYASSDLVSSGMPLEDLQKVRNLSLPLSDRWKIIKPYWEMIQNTGYARALNIAVRDLYNVNGINEETYKDLALKMEKANKAGLYKWILKDKSRIEISILDSLDVPINEVDRNFFAPVLKFDDFVMASGRRDFEVLSKRCRIPIHSFDDLIHALELEFNRVSNMIVGVKIALAYLRSLRFDKVSRSEADEVFTNIYNLETLNVIHIDDIVYRVPEALSSREAKPLQNFMLHKIIQLAAKKSLPIQIHTGIHEGNENILTNSDPTLLVNLFREYQEVKFDIFHGSYPFMGKLAALAKNFPNVYIDMCWLHIISPFAARQALSDWLDAVPWNKILGFGGDYIFVEGVYGHSVIARENIIRVLTEKVEEGSLTKKQAFDLASQLLRENAYRLFFTRS